MAEGVAVEVVVGGASEFCPGAVGAAIAGEVVVDEVAVVGGVIDQAIG